MQSNETAFFAFLFSNCRCKSSIEEAMEASKLAEEDCANNRGPGALKRMLQTIPVSGEEVFSF